MIVELTTLLIPIGICVILPIMIVWLCLRSSNKKSEQRVQIILEAIRHGDNVDTEKILKDFENKKRPYLPHERQQRRLLRGVACSLSGLGLGAYSYLSGSDSDGDLLVLAIVLLAVGIGFMTVYFTGRKYADKHKSSEE